MDAAVTNDPTSGTGGTEVSGGGGAVVNTGGVTMTNGGMAAATETGGVLAGGSLTSVRGLRADFTVTTTSPGGDYSPKNIGAIWVQDAQGNWIKTLEHWAGFRWYYLFKYNAANPNGNVVDAVTSATLTRHGTHQATWNLLDANGDEVPDGDYSIVMEMTDQESMGPSTAVVFTLGSDPLTQSYPDDGHFTNMSLQVH